MPYINCQIFKKTGKYYTDESVYIREGTKDYDIPQQVYQNRNIEDMIYVGKTLEYEIPFLVQASITGDFLNDIRNI